MKLPSATTKSFPPISAHPEALLVPAGRVKLLTDIP